TSISKLSIWDIGGCGPRSDPTNTSPHRDYSHLLSAQILHHLPPRPQRNSLRWSGSRLPGQLGRLVLLDALGDHGHGIDAVEPPRVLPEQLALNGGRHLVLLHELERFPGVLGVVVRIVG